MIYAICFVYGLGAGYLITLWVKEGNDNKRIEKVEKAAKEFETNQRIRKLENRIAGIEMERAGNKYAQDKSKE